MRYRSWSVAVVAALLSCGPRTALAQLESCGVRIAEISAGINARVGVAVVDIETGDTLMIDGSGKYPMQSVFKFPLALAVLNRVDEGSLSLDRKIRVTKRDLLPNTWSPLRERYPDGDVDVALDELIRYTVAQSDNNGCDILFRLLGGTAPVEAYIHGLGVTQIAIVATEQEMHRDSTAQYRNWCSPAAMGQLLRKFHRGEVLSESSTSFLRKTMEGTSTGARRLKGLLPEGTVVAHKTGSSGADARGLVAATNDVGIVTLPSGRHVAIAVFVSDAMEEERTCEDVIARTARTVWDAFPVVPARAGGAWRSLFDGRSLDGWALLNGTALYSVEGGELVGRCVEGSPNSFLCSSEAFGDFIFECEVKIDSTLNSGVQVRSSRSPDHKEGRVYGYQVEIDASERAWTGGIYDESRRGWLHTLEGQEASRKAFRMDGWNRIRVEAFGHSIRTWVNGVPCADILDNESPSGFFALQVHGVGNDSTKIGRTVRWKNIRVMTQGIAEYRTPDDRLAPQYNFLPNTLSDREREQGWELLWDGKSSKGWRGARLDRFPGGGWDIADGVLTVLGSGGSESNAGGDIVTTGEYGDFDLTVEFKVTRGANSGIKYFVDTELNRGEGSAIGCEYQILDDAAHEDAAKGVDGNRKLAGLYDLVPPVNVRFNGVGEWNRARILAKGKHVEHWLNGFKTVEYERGTQMWRALVSHSKYVAWPGFGEARQGHILLQDHGTRVSFRSLKIRAQN